MHPVTEEENEITEGEVLDAPAPAEPLIQPKVPVRLWMWLLSAMLGSMLLLSILVYIFTQAPSGFMQETTVYIEEGSSASMVAHSLHEQGVVRSGDILYLLLAFAYDPSQIKAGSYLLEADLDVFEVARHIMSNVPQEELLSITLPEGYTAEEYARITSSILSDFDATLFATSGKEIEGYLFPETYLVPEDFSAQELLDLQTTSYNEFKAEHQEAFDGHYLTEYEILVLASIIEREANTEESKRKVAGVFQNRIEIDMPLQADASIEYVLNKPLNELTAADLKIDTPYNTYLNKGLPPTPIGNPGSEAILAVLDPIESDALFYITGNDGIFYFAKTYAEHKRNIANHLR